MFIDSVLRKDHIFCIGFFSDKILSNSYQNENAFFKMDIINYFMVPPDNENFANLPIRSLVLFFLPFTPIISILLTLAIVVV